MKINYTRYYHNGLSKKECPYGETIRHTDGKDYVRWVGDKDCNDCKHNKRANQNYVICNKESEG